jgi:hypothetical protein
VHNNLGREVEEDEFEQADGKSEAGPIMSVLQNLQTIAIELDVAIKVHVVESLHRNLVPTAVFNLVGFILEGEIVLDRTSRKSGLFILARSEGRCECPEAEEDREGGEETEENSGLQSTANFPGQVEWDEAKKGEEEDVGETFSSGAICRERCIFNCWVLRIESAEFN